MFKLVSLALVALAAVSAVNAVAVIPRQAAKCRPRPSPEPTSIPTTTTEPTPTSEIPSPVDTPTPVENHSSGYYHTGGQITTYFQEGRAGACGESHSDNDYIAAIPFSLYGNTGTHSSYCGMKIRVSWKDKSVEVTIQDACEACGPDSIDLSTAAFKAITGDDTGSFGPMTWEQIN